MFDNFRNSINKIKCRFLGDKRVALVKLEGIIIDSGNLPVVTKIIEAFDEIIKQDIKSVVLRINSPGGTVGASQEIYSAIQRLKSKGIKVIASFGDIAASGGVYVAAASDRIVSNPGTITGSIGVILKSKVIKDLYQKIGIDQEVIKSGTFKDILSEARYFTDEEKTLLQNMVDNTYNQFIKAVAEGRNLDIETVKSFADGRIFTGIQAKDYGLVDQIGTQADAVDLAAEIVGIKGKPNVIDMTPKKNLWQKVTGSNMGNLLENIGINSIYSGVPLWLMPGL